MIEDIFFKVIDEKTHGIYKQRAFLHSLRVSTLAQSIAYSLDLDSNLCKIMGMFHDIAQFVNYNSFEHARLGSEMTYKLLKDYMNSDDLDIVCNAILHHSDKDHIHDVYSEVLKDADLLAQYYDGQVLDQRYIDRIKKYMKIG